MNRETILCQIISIEDYCLENGRALTDLDPLVLHVIAIRLEMAAAKLRAEGDSCATTLPTGGAA
jgi:hypothetical protein